MNGIGTLDRPAQLALPPGAGLPSVILGGTQLNAGVTPSGFTAVIEDVTGWNDSPVFTGNDTDRLLNDGAEPGPKIYAARQVTLSGAASGQLPDLMAWRDQLAGLAGARGHADLAITDMAGRALVASVRADSDQFKWTWVGLGAFRWQMVLTAPDPLLYEQAWRTATLSNITGSPTGRTYKRLFGWTYGQSQTPNSALLANPGNVPCQVWALYTGDLAQSQLTDGTGTIWVAPVAAGVQITIETDTLAATAPGGATRAGYVQPGSTPLLVSPGGETWWLYATGGGSVQLAWRGAWA